MLQVIPSAIVAPESEWSGPRHLVVLNRGPTAQRVAVLAKSGRFTIQNAADSEFEAYSSPCEHVVFEVSANAHVKVCKSRYSPLYPHMMPEMIQPEMLTVLIVAFAASFVPGLAYGKCR
jgi:hypothetical protein